MDYLIIKKLRVLRISEPRVWKFLALSARLLQFQLPLPLPLPLLSGSKEKREKEQRRHSEAGIRLHTVSLSLSPRVTRSRRTDCKFVASLFSPPHVFCECQYLTLWIHVENNTDFFLLLESTILLVYIKNNRGSKYINKYPTFLL